MGRGQKSKQNLPANSRLATIPYFNPKIAVWDQDSKETTVRFKAIEYIDYSIGLLPTKERTLRNFPIIFKDNGTPWDLGNLYLQRYFYDAAKYSEPSIETIHSKAKALTNYLRWIESMQINGHDIHELQFPEDPEDRVTYQYHRYLTSQLRQRILGSNTVKERMSQVIIFYRKIIQWGLVERSNILNAPFKEYTIGISYINSDGLKSMMNALTTDISFRGSRKSSNDNVVTIEDGGNLIPLTPSEEKVVMSALATYGNRTFELIVKTALKTGARLQTVCTIRTCDLIDASKQKPNQHGEVTLWAGEGFLSDIKGERQHQKRINVYFPADLVKELLEYAESELSIERRKKSYYGNTENNYLFLNADGRPFYVSHQEMLDRSNPEYSERVSLKDRVDFPIAKGQSINGLLSRLIKKIHKHHPEFRTFRFHDLRATYGMNFLRDWINKQKNPNIGVGELKIKLGHSGIKSTYQYLNYAAEVEQITKLEDEHYKILNGESPS